MSPNEVNIQIHVSPYVLEGDDMTITCDTNLSPSTNVQFAFYRERKKVKRWNPSNQYRVLAAQLEDSGNYTCKVQIGSVKKRSDVTYVQIHELFTLPRITVSPDPVLEGDHMTLTCDTKLSPRRATTELQFKFYRNGINVQEFSSSNQYRVSSAQLEDSGNYICKVQTETGSVRKKSNVKYVQIQELFTLPQITVNPDMVLEGDHMTITCDTKPSPHGATTELQFEFYRNGVNVKRFNPSNQYRVPSAQLEDSGNYTCKVQTVTGSVRKRSKPSLVQIQELLIVPQIKGSPDLIVERGHMTITCDANPHPSGTVHLFGFYRNGANVQSFSLSNQYQVVSAQLEDSGNYTCEVQTVTGSVRRSN
ncbi:hypothetical protein GDO86_016652, partial [Hymenochirus boettgeri]